MPPSPAPTDAVREAADLLKKQAALLAKLEKALASDSSSEADKALEAFKKLTGPVVSDVTQATAAWVTEQKANRRDRLRVGLRERCATAGVPFEVVSQTPLEVRLTPFTVRLDLTAGEATLRYANEVVDTCEATPEAIWASRTRGLADLDGRPWDAEKWHARLRRAWQRAGGGDAPLSVIHTEMVFLQQSPAFWADPSPRRFEAYPKTHFAWDLWRLKRARAFTHGGWRLAISVAHASAMRDKATVWFLEDDRGQGQFYHAMKFVRSEDADLALSEPPAPPDAPPADSPTPSEPADA